MPVDNREMSASDEGRERHAARVARVGYNQSMSKSPPGPESTSGHVEIIARGVAVDRREIGGTRVARVLMCQNKKRGYYYLPGGHVDFGETAAGALQREIMEEMGIASIIGPPLLMHECAFHDGKGQHHELNIVFHVEHLGQVGKPWPDPPPCAEDHIAFAWLPLSELERFDVRPARASAWLREHAEALESGGMPLFAWISDMAG